MSNTKHTPGPWEYLATNANTLNDYTRTIFATVGECVAHVETNDDDGKPTEKGEANARLIAAAPELLEALEAVLRFDANMPGEYKHDVTLAIKVRKAISKATNATL
jgi:hypothetical protein